MALYAYIVNARLLATSNAVTRTVQGISLLALHASEDGAGILEKVTLTLLR